MRTDGQNEKHDEVNSQFTQFIERNEMGMTAASWRATADSVWLAPQ